MADYQHSQSLHRQLRQVRRERQRHARSAMRQELEELKKSMHTFTSMPPSRAHVTTAEVGVQTDEIPLVRPRLYENVEGKVIAKMTRAAEHQKRVLNNAARKEWALKHGRSLRPWWYGCAPRPVGTPIVILDKLALPEDAVVDHDEHGHDRDRGRMEHVPQMGSSTGMVQTSHRPPDTRQYEVGDKVVVVSGFMTDSHPSVRVHSDQKGEIRLIHQWYLLIKFEGVKHRQKVKVKNHHCIQGDGFSGW